MTVTCPFCNQKFKGHRSLNGHKNKHLVPVRVKATGKSFKALDYGPKFIPRYWDPQGQGWMAEEVEVLK